VNRGRICVPAVWFRDVGAPLLRISRLAFLIVLPASENHCTSAHHHAIRSARLVSFVVVANRHEFLAIDPTIGSEKELVLSAFNYSFST